MDDDNLLGYNRIKTSFYLQKNIFQIPPSPGYRMVRLHRSKFTQFQLFIRYSHLPGSHRGKNCHYASKFRNIYRGFYRCFFAGMAYGSGLPCRFSYYCLCRDGLHEISPGQIKRFPKNILQCWQSSLTSLFLN